MALRPSFALTLAALVTSCGGNPSSPAMVSEARCATGAAPGGASVPLRQQHATARSMIADRIARQRLAVLHVDTGPACVPHVEVLRCTRHVVWKTEPLRAPGMAYPPWTAWAEPPWERYDRRRTPEVSFAQYMNSSQPSFIQEVPRVPFLDPYREEELPPIDASELAGPDCARATHYVRVSHGGAYRTLSTADHRVLDGSTCQPPASCADPIDLELEPVGRRGCPGLSTRTPNGCIALRRPVRFASAAPRPRAGELDAPGPTARPEPCIPPAAGQPTAELARVFARFRSGDFGGSLADLERAGAGETHDDRGNVELAQWYFFHAARLSGDFAGALGALEAIASTCHGYRARAVAIAAIANRRATIPPSE